MKILPRFDYVKNKDYALTHQVAFNYEQLYMLFDTLNDIIENQNQIITRLESIEYDKGQNEKV